MKANDIFTGEEIQDLIMLIALKNEVPCKLIEVHGAIHRSIKEIKTNCIDRLFDDCFPKE